MIKLIMCSTLNGGIGKDNELLYNMKEDMAFFKNITKGQTILMGDNTWESLPKKPLPYRQNVIAGFTQAKLDKIKEEHSEIETTTNLFSYAIQKSLDNEDVWVIGGASIYNWFIDMRLVDEAYVTLVPTVRKDADAYVKLEKLFKYLPHRDIIDEFEYEGMNVKILKLQKHRK